MSERHKRKPPTSESAFVRLCLSYRRSQYATWLLLNNLLQKKEPCRQTSEELHLLLSGTEHAFKIKAFHRTIVRKCLFRSFPLPFLMEAGLESFWNFPRLFIFVFKRTALSDVRPLPQSFAEVSMARASFGRDRAWELGAGSSVPGCTQSNLSLEKMWNIKITFTSSSTSTAHPTGPTMTCKGIWKRLHDQGL